MPFQTRVHPLLHQFKDLLCHVHLLVIPVLGVPFSPRLQYQGVVMSVESWVTCGGSVLIILGVHLSRGVSHRLHRQLLYHPPPSQLEAAPEGEVDQVVVRPESMHSQLDPMLLLQML